MRGRHQERGFGFGQLLFGCLIIAFVSFFVWISKDVLMSPSFDGYAPVPCRIEKSKVERERLDSFVFTATFSYEYAGRRYTSNSLRRPGDSKFCFEHLGDRLPLLEKYASGATQTCMVDPNNPATAVLPVEKHSGGGWLPVSAVLIAALTLFLSVGAGFIASAFPSVRQVFTSCLRTFFTGGFLVLFALPFLLIGTIMPISMLRAKGEAEGYVPVQAKILYSGVSSHTSGGKHRSTTYSVRVGYEYVVEGRKYESDRFSVAEIGTSDYESHRRRADGYKPGAEVTAYVSPLDPSRSVLVRSDTTEWFPVLGMCVFGIVGLAIMTGGICAIVSALRRKGGPRSFENHVLRRSRADMISIGCFAGLWNLISWTVVGGFWAGGSFEKFKPEMLLIALFPIVGIVLVAVFIRMLVRDLKAPAFTMSLTCTMWKSGSPAQIAWRLERADEVESLEVILEGAKWEGSGKYRRKKVVSTTTCCSYDGSSIPSSWQFGFMVPRVRDGVTWSFAVTMKAKDVRRPYKLDFGLPDVS